ncbi:MAG: hypothetical protein IKN73_03880 [Alphaproteobacteria bacterium]|nr:hypothetical protein [Alphaproteobacteria bacterium]
MKKNILAFLCGFAAPLACFASNEGVPSYYIQNTKPTHNSAAYNKYQQYGYTKYVGNTGKKQVLSSNQYSYQVPNPYYNPKQNYRGTMTANGISTPTADLNTTIYAGYSRRFADFEFKTGVNSILEWDDMQFNEINLGAKHIFDIRGFDLMVYGDYSYGKLASGGLSMDYDLEPYDYAYPADGIFTISMGDQSGTTNHLRFGIAAHSIWEFQGWKLTPHIGYEIFKHDLKMSNHIYPNPGVYLPLMTDYGDYVFGDLDGNYYAVSQNTTIDEEAGLYQICMGPEDIKIVAAGGGASDGMLYPLTSLATMDYNSSLGTVPWGVEGGDCVVIGGDGLIKVDGVTHIYNTTWSGFYIGLELEKQMTLADKLRFYVQVSMPKYSSEGTWPNRDDWQQNPSFLDEGSNDSFAYTAEMEYNYQLSDRLHIALKADTNYFYVGKIPGELYVAETVTYIDDGEGGFIVETEPAHTEKVSESLKNATWRSYGLHLGLKYSF